MGLAFLRAVLLEHCQYHQLSGGGQARSGRLICANFSLAGSQQDGSSPVATSKSSYESNIMAKMLDKGVFS
jgi:hypothetical protein